MNRPDDILKYFVITESTVCTIYCRLYVQRGSIVQINHNLQKIKNKTPHIE